MEIKKGVDASGERDDKINKARDEQNKAVRNTRGARVSVAEQQDHVVANNHVTDKTRDASSETRRDTLNPFILDPPLCLLLDFTCNNRPDSWILMNHYHA